jgi:RNA polymerase primary sigma factor
MEASLKRLESGREEDLEDGENVEDDDDEGTEINRLADEDDLSDGRRGWTTRRTSISALRLVTCWARFEALHLKKAGWHWERLDRTYHTWVITRKPIHTSPRGYCLRKKSVARDLDSNRYTVSSNSLQAYLQQIRQIPLLSREQEVELATRAQAGDQEAFEQLVVSNLRYVVSVARRHLGYGLALPDLINEGNLGLIQAAKRFDPTRGVKFITYAVWWIRQAITHALAGQGGVVALPVKQLEKLRKILEGYRRYVQQTGTEPNVDELAGELGLPAKEVETILHIYSHLSLDAPIGAEGETSFLDILASRGSPSEEETYMKGTLARQVQELLGQLPAREQQVLRLRFGMDDDPKTLEEIGAMLGITRERVRQIEKQAKDRLQVKAKMRALQEYLN